VNVRGWGVQSECSISDNMDWGELTPLTIALVEHHDRVQTRTQCALQHVASLGHWALQGVHQQQAAVHTLRTNTETW
jgi:hypothetical protein